MVHNKKLMDGGYSRQNVCTGAGFTGQNWKLKAVLVRLNQRICITEQH